MHTCPAGGVRLYDGDQKVAGLDDTTVEVTSHRILARQNCLGLGLVSTTTTNYADYQALGGALF